MDTKAIVNHVTDLVLEAMQEGTDRTSDDPQRLQFEINRAQKKKEAVMDSYFSGEITREDMQAMSDQYERQRNGIQRRLEEAEKRKARKLDPEGLRAEIQRDVAAILKGDTESEVFYKTLLQSLTVFNDRHVELRLNHLPQIYHFTDLGAGTLFHPPKI